MTDYGRITTYMFIISNRKVNKLFIQIFSGYPLGCSMTAVKTATCSSICISDVTWSQRQTPTRLGRTFVDKILFRQSTRVTAK